MKKTTGARFMARLVVLVMMLQGGSSAWALTGIWCQAGGETSYIWTVGSSWSGGNVPASTNQALMGYSKIYQLVATAPDVGEIYYVMSINGATVEANSGGSLRVLGNVTLQSTAETNSYLKVQGGNLTVDGTASIYNLSLTNGILDMTDGALTAYGPFTFSGGTLKNPTTVAIGGTSPGNLIQSGGILERSASGTTSLGAYTLNGSAMAVVSNGTLSVAGGISNSVMPGQSVLRVEGGTLNLNSKSATVGQLAFRSGTISNVGTAGITLNGTGDALVLRNTTAAFTVNLTGNSGGNIVFENDNNGTGIVSGGLDLGGLTRTVNVGDGSAAEDLRMSGPIANGGLTKSGVGTLTLSGVNTYSGTTLVSAGTLLGGTGGSCLNSPVVVADGVTNGILVLTYGGQWACSVLTYTGSSAGLAFDLTNFPPSTGYAPLQINGDLNVTGTVAVVVRNGYWPSAGTYPLVSYSGNLNGSGSFSLAGLPANVSATLVNNTGAKRLDLSVTAVPTYAQQTLSVWTNLVSGSAGGTWGTSANWSGGVPNATDAIADFSTLNITATSIVTNDAPRTAGTLRFGDMTTASHDWIVTNSTLSLATTVGLPFITVSNRTATIYSILTGTQGLIKNGAGSLSLNSVNTFTGGTTVDQGTLTLNASDVAVRGTVTVNAGGTLSVAGPAWVGFGQNANKITTLNLVGGTVNNTQSAAMLKDATVNMTAGTWAGSTFYWINSKLNTLASANPSTISGGVLFYPAYGSPVLDMTVADGSAATDLLISGVIADGVGPGSVIKTGAGLLKITSVNTYTGGTTVNGGPLELLGSNNIGRVKGVLTVNSGATVITTGDGTGFGTNQLAALNITNGLVKATSSDCAIWNITTGVNMTGGELQSNGGTNSASGFAFQWNRTPLNVNAGTGTALISGRINLRSDGGYSNSVFSVADGSADPDLCVSAAITGTNVTLIKTGAGAMVFAGSNTYSAATLVSNGLLRVDGVLAAGGGEVRVSGGATLAGTGTVAQVITVASNAVLTAGNPSVTNRVGTLTATAGVTLQAGAVYTVRIGSAGCDLLNAAGGLTLTTGAELAVSMDPALGKLPPGYTATVATGSVTGQFKQQVFNLPNQPPLKVSYTGNAIRLVVPSGTLIRVL